MPTKKKGGAAAKPHPYEALVNGYLENEDVDRLAQRVLDLRLAGEYDIAKVKAAIPDGEVRELVRRAELKLRRALPSDNPHHIAKAGSNGGGSRKPKQRTLREVVTEAVERLTDASDEEVLVLGDAPLRDLENAVARWRRTDDAMGAATPKEGDDVEFPVADALLEEEPGDDDLVPVGTVE